MSGRKIRLHAVVVALLDGIEHVIVAARAAERYPEKRGAHDVGHLGQHLVAAACDLLVAGILAQRTETIEARGNQSFVLIRADLISGELLEYETVVRLVVIECVDDVIPVTPGVSAVGVVFEAIGFGESHDVEPMPAPALAILRACQEAFNQLGVRIGRFVGDKPGHFAWRRRKPDQVKVNSPDQRRAIGRPRRAETFFLQSRQNEGVYRVLDPVPVRRQRELRRLGPASFNESPVLALGWSVSAEGRGVVRADQVRKSGTCDEHQVECASLHRTPGIILRSDSLCLRVLAVKADPISPRRHEGSRSVIPSAPVPGRNNHHVWSPGPHACRSAAGMNLGGRRCFVACSNAYAIFMSAGSLHALPKNEIPIGKPKTKPAGTLMFG